MSSEPWPGPGTCSVSYKTVNFCPNLLDPSQAQSGEQALSVMNTDPQAKVSLDLQRLLHQAHQSG